MPALAALLGMGGGAGAATAGTAAAGAGAAPIAGGVGAAGLATPATGASLFGSAGSSLPVAGMTGAEGASMAIPAGAPVSGLGGGMVSQAPSAGLLGTGGSSPFFQNLGQGMLGPLGTAPTNVGFNAPTIGYMLGQQFGQSLLQPQQQNQGLGGVMQQIAQLRQQRAPQGLPAKPMGFKG